MKKLPHIANDPFVVKIVEMALHEDIMSGDVTTEGLFKDISLSASAAIISREKCIVSGTTVAAICFKKVDPSLKSKILVNDGNSAKPGTKIMTIKGNACAILKAERTALNFLQRMSGIATLTNSFVKIAAPHGVIVLDTRKTTPLLRKFEKYAVLCGGGTNHRIGLYDMFLIKDNHRFFWAKSTGKSLSDAVRKLRNYRRDLQIEVEVENQQQIADALQGDPDWLLLDNFPSRLLRKCIKIIDKKAKIEISGGINIKKIKKIIRSGIDAVSIGALTHSFKSIDFSLEFQE